MAKHKRVLYALKIKFHKFLARFKKRPKRYIVAIVLVVLSVPFFAYQLIEAFTVQSETNVYISSDKLAQAETLLVVVKNEPKEINGMFGAVSLRFFRDQTNKDWVALVGIAVDKKPGNYTLVINEAKKELFKKEIVVTKRDFPITPLFISAALSQQGYTAKKIVTTIINKENKTLNEVLDIVTPTSYINKPFIYPLSEIKVVGKFGDIRASEPYQIQHLGVDLKAKAGTHVQAVNNGKVVLKKNMPDYGNTLIVDHGLGMYSLYLHLSEFKVTNGQIVNQGDIIGLSGATGYAIGPHLHFSIKVRKMALDPLSFIKTSQTEW